MSTAEIIMLLLHPALTFAFGLACLVFYIRVFVRYTHVCFNRYDILLVIVAIGGVVAFDGILLLYTGVCGALVEPCANLLAISAVSRIMRLLAVTAWFIIGHSAAVRQRKAREKHIQEALDDRANIGDIT
jgi:hypothetical protein